MVQEIGIYANPYRELNDVVCFSGMGVKNLTAFVWHHKLLRDEQLPRGNLVIDGNSLLWTLFNCLKDVTECVYQEFARKLGTFFSNLKR